MTSPSDATDHPKPVVEPSPATADPTTRALNQRIRQQEILAELGVVHIWAKIIGTNKFSGFKFPEDFVRQIPMLPLPRRLLAADGAGDGDGVC